MTTVAHELVRMVATTWDEAGYRPPRNWTVECTCGEVARSLSGQMAAMDWWDAHRTADVTDDGGPCCIAVVTSGGRDHIPGCHS